MSSKNNRVMKGDIAGGQKSQGRDIGDNMTIQVLWDTYRWFPGFEDMINLEVDALFSNGVNEKDTITPDRTIESKEAVRWSLLAGYSVSIVDTRNGKNKVEAWHPYIDGIGFDWATFTPKGHPTLINVYVQSDEAQGQPIPIEIPHYPCELDEDGEFDDLKPIPGGYGFFHHRTQGNIKGVMGLPKYLNLVDAVRLQWDIIKSYGPYAEKQGWGMPVVYQEDNSKQNKAIVKNQFASQPTNNRILMLSTNDLVEWMSPGQGSYDPFPMLQWLNTLMARKTQMNRLMLEGASEGQLSSSETAISNWQRKRAEDQVYWRTQLLPVWLALGATEDCNFRDPAKPSFISLMEGMEKMRAAMDGLVAKEDIVKQMNVYLQNNDLEMELHVAEEGEWEQNNNGDDKDGNPGSESDNKGSKTKQE